MTPGLLLSVAVVLALIHFGIPLSYYLYIRIKRFRRPWNIRGESYIPKVTIIVPTNSETKLIVKSCTIFAWEDR